MPRHTHVVFSIHAYGKADSFYGTCHCGKEELFATWWPHPPKGWSKKQWEYLVWAALHLLGSIHPRSSDQWTDEDLKKYRDKARPKLWESTKKRKSK